jgi:cytoskeleton protein RodZ
MSELERNSGTPAPVSLPTAGRMLQNARRAAGLSLEELATRLKVSVARLQALEEDRFDEWPDMNLVRAVSASVCRHVRLDPTIILALLPKAEKILWSSVGSNSAVGFRARSGLTLRNPSRFANGSLLLLALGIGITALGIYFGPSIQSLFQDFWSRQLQPSASAVPSAIIDPVLPPDAGPTDTRVGSGTAETPVGLPAAQGTVTGSVAAVPSLGISQSVPASALSATSTKAGVGGTSTAPVLTFKARGLTWVAVTDAQGVSVLRKTLVAGETASASGALPLWVVVGRADHTDVLVRGQSLKLEPSAPENVARFKVQ